MTFKRKHHANRPADESSTSNPPTEKTIALCMIVKNEAAVVARCIDSIRPVVDNWLIIDTGSTDDTEAKIRSCLAGIPGEYLHRPWVNFGVNRTELVRQARGRADYLLLLDADMEVIVAGFDKRLTADAYLLKYSGQLDYAQKLLVRADLDWQYIGSTHEYIHCPAQQSVELLRSLVIVHHGDGGCRDEKLSRDEALLKQAVASNPRDARSVFYLAQTCRDAGKLEEAIELYRRRSSMGGWAEEAWYATYQVGRLLERVGRWDQALCWLLKAFEMRPGRAEPLHEIARHFRRCRQYELGYLFAARAAEIPYPSDLLFVERAVYEHGVDDELAVCAYYVGKPAESSALCGKLLSRAALPESARRRILKNKAFADGKRKRLVFGLGTGRCGTKSLSVLLNAQSGVRCGHETMLLPWTVDRRLLDRLLGRMQHVDAPCAGEVAFYLLHYVEPILELYPDARFICLKRERGETVDSYMKWTGNKNHWTARNGRTVTHGWIQDRYDICYPQFDADKRAGIEMYWDYYYAFASYLEARYSDRFRRFSIHELNSEEGQRDILSFAGVARDAMQIEPGIRVNEGARR